jgi:hypothetical protein
MKNNMLKLGTKTKYGEIAAITNRDGERYYMIVDDKLGVSFLPADVVEEDLKESEL